MRIADSVNHKQIDDEITDFNSQWNKKLLEIANHIETLTVLSGNWEDFEKRIESFENQLNAVDEKSNATDNVIKSKQRLIEIKDIYQVSFTN